MIIIESILFLIAPLLAIVVKIYAIFMTLITETDNGYKLLVPIMEEGNIDIHDIKLYNNPHIYYFSLIGDISDYEAFSKFCSRSKCDFPNIIVTNMGLLRLIHNDGELYFEIYK